MCRRSDFTSTASSSIANLLHRARMPWILEHPSGSWLWDVPTIEALAAQPRTVWSSGSFLCRKRTLFLNFCAEIHVFSVFGGNIILVTTRDVLSFALVFSDSFPAESTYVSVWSASSPNAKLV